MRILKMGQLLEVDNDQLRAFTKADPLTSTWEVAKELSVNHSMVIQHLNQIRKVRKLDKWVPHELTENQKNHRFEVSSSLILHITRNHFSNRLWCAVKSGFYKITGNDQLSGRTKKKLQSTSQSQTCTKKRSWSLFGDLLPVWSTTAFWIVVKPLHLRGLLSKSMRCTDSSNTCSQHWSTERPQFFRTTPNCTPYKKHFKSSTNRVTEFRPSAIFTWPLAKTTSSSSILTTFCRENASTTSRRQKMLSKSSLNPEAWIFMLRE